MAGRIAAVIVCTALVAGCDSIGFSEAYRLGVQTGQEMADIQSQAEALDTWLDTNSSADFDGDEYCSSAWGLVGMFSGLKNTKENEADFVRGCRSAMP